MIPEMIQKVVNLSPEWVAGFNRNQWQVYSGMGGSFEPESAAQGVKDAELSKDPWLEAVKDLGSDQKIILLNRLSKLEEDYSQEYLPKRIGNRVVRLKEIVSKLESFINLNESESQTTEHLKDE